MSFARVEYLPFLALVVAVFQYVPARARVLTLLAASYTFYVWVHPAHALLLVASTAIDYSVGLALGRTEDPRRRNGLLVLSLALNLGLLGVFKYAGFALANLNALLGLFGRDPVPWSEPLLPLGISFYTFQTLSYTIDVWRRRIEPCRDPAAYALYVSFFPQLVAGPIERAGHLLPQLARTERLTAANLSAGARLVLFGLVKKVVVADRLLLSVRPVFERPADGDPLTLTLCGVAMFVVLYLDFSAYTDMARGSARLFGVRLVKNFDRPFLATSLSELALRWHMSLIRWIFDYVYAPLMRGGPGAARTPAGARARIWRANLVVMGLFGLWHGAAWTFVLWGLAYGVFISIQHVRRFERHAAGRGAPRAAARGRRALSWAATFFAAGQFIVLFFSPDLGFAVDYFRAQLTPSLPDAAGWRWIGATAGTLTLLFAVHAAPRVVDLERAWTRAGPVGRALAFAAAVALLLVWRVPEAQPFIYFRF